MSLTVIDENPNLTPEQVQEAMNTVFVFGYRAGTFAWAMQQAIEGKTVRRVGRLIGNEGYVIDQGKLRRLLEGLAVVDGVTLRTEDLTATDWETVDESKP